MPASLTVDNAEYRNLIRRCSALSKKTFAEFINDKMFFLIQGAMAGTPVTSPDQIDRELRVEGYELARTKSGKIKKGKRAKGNAIFGRNSLLFHLAAKSVGRSAASEGEIVQKGLQILAARKRSVGVERGGWLQALRYFAKVTGRPTKEKGKAVKAKPTSKAARDEWNAEATVAYNVLSKKGSIREISPRVIDALRASFDAEAAGMVAYLAKKSQVIADEFNAK